MSNAPQTDDSLLVLLRKTGSCLIGYFGDSGGGGSEPAVLLASYDIADPVNIDTFTRAGAAGYTTTGDADEFQREAAADVLRIHNGCVLLEDDPTACALVAPTFPESVAPDGLDFAVSFADIPITASLLRYEWRLDGAGAWTDNAGSTAITGTSTAGSHVLNVRAVSTSGVAGATGTSASFDLEGFTPPSGLQVWLKADAESYADNDQVPTATDQSGNTNDATQATGAQQPTYKTGIINGLPVYRFDGSADNLAGVATSSAARTVFVVVKKRSAVTGDSQVVLSFANTISAVIFSNSGFFASGFGWYSPATAIGGTVTDPNIIELKFASASSLTPYLNGSAGSTVDPENDYTSSNIFRLGSTNSGPSNPADVDVAELLIFDSALSDGDRATVRAYLASKYAITAS